MHVELFLLLATVSVGCLSQEGLDYLRSAIRDLKNMNLATINRRVDSLHMAPATPSEGTSVHRSIPSLALTKGELAALYETAVNQGNTVRLDPGNGNILHAAVHELEADNEKAPTIVQQDTDSPGYYYYYYPLKSFMDEISSGTQEKVQVDDGSFHHHHSYHKTPPPHHQYHSHTHQHTINVYKAANQTTAMAHTGTGISKGLEPLFMAISGFIGMAVMFILSVIVLPKFGVLKSRGGKQQFGPETYSITGIVLRAIEGRHCRERIACEIGKTADAYNLYNNRFVKLIRRFVPTSLQKQIDKVGKYTDKKYKCGAIQCKRKNAVPSKLKSERKQMKS